MNSPEALGSLETLSDRIQSNPDYLKANKAYVQDYIEHMKARGANLKTIHKHLYSIEFLLNALGSKKNLKKVDKKDIECVIAMVEIAKREDGTEYTSEHKVRTRTIIKAFYKHLLGDDEYYPKEVAWIKTTGKRSERVLPEDLLSEDDVLRMLKAARQARDKAVIALLYDSGIRMGELFSIRKKDVNLESTPAHITVKGKTGPRQIPISFSVPYLSQYMNLIEYKSPEDPILMGMGPWINKDKRIEYRAVNKLLKVCAERAGIKKRIYPHLFRHSRASSYANKLTEQQLKAFFGWTGSSNMAATYVHLSGRDIDNAVLVANGEKPIETQVKSKLVARACGRCQTPNTIDSKYCVRCGNPIDEKTMMEAQSKEASLKQGIAEALQDPKAIEDIVHAYLLMQGKKKGTFK